MENALDTGRRSPHIVMYIGSLQKGGAERVMSNLAEYFYREGWRVTLVTTYFHPPEYLPSPALWDPETGEPFAGEGIARVYSDPDVSLLSGSRIHNFKVRFDNLRSIWKKLKPDIILSFSGKNNLMAAATSRGVKRRDESGRLAQVPAVVSVRGNPAREYAGRLMKTAAFFTFRKAEGIVLQTKGAMAFFPKDIQRKACILPNSVNPGFMLPLYEGERKKEIVLVGRLDENKNQALALRAAAASGALGEGWKLILYGDGPSASQLKALSKELGIEDSTEFAGIVSDVPERIRTASVFILPSKAEGMPNALIEAMSLGLACISTDCPSYGPRDILEDGKNGYLVPVDDVSAMAEKLTLLTKDEELRRRLGKEAFRVQEAYAPEKINGQWKAYFNSLMNL